MKITRRKNIYRFQEGGPMPEDQEMDQQTPEEGAPEEGGQPEQQQDPLMQLAQMAAQALQSQDCQMAMQVCQAFIQMIQQAQGGGQAQEPQGEPVFRKGGKLAYRIRK